ncbi:MAG: aldolase/citrate lyase family protein [Acidobacteriota bacterium]|nr:aldolase/citrate lyase family protein [Acidobacteriota bacterium]
MQPNKVKEALKAGRLQLGSGYWQLRSPEVARIYAAAGFHWTFIDTEHGGFDLETVQDICRVANLAGLCPLVRVPDLQYPLISRALDCGAQGIVFPRVESPEVLAMAISWTKFPPVGIRGYGLTTLQANFEPLSFVEILEQTNRNTMVVMQIETQLAVDRREELLSVPGIDAVMIGPADLSISLGVPGQFEHPKVVTAMEAVRDTCLRRGIAPGTQTRSVALAKFWKERGMLFLGCSNETTMLLDRATEITSNLK